MNGPLEDQDAQRNKDQQRKSNTKISIQQDEWWPQMKQQLGYNLPKQYMGKKGDPSTSDTHKSDPPWKWDNATWREAFEAVILNQRLFHDSSDDMLFFVPQPTSIEAIADPAQNSFKPQTTQPSEPYFVRRFDQSQGIVHGLNHAWWDIDWYKTVQLNLAMQCQFRLTVLACRQEDIKEASAPNRPHGPWHRVQTPLYASPDAADLQINTSKQNKKAQPTPCYPNLSFSVHTFEYEYAGTWLKRPGHCYCVILEVAPPPTIAARIARLHVNADCIPRQPASDAYVAHRAPQSAPGDTVDGEQEGGEAQAPLTHQNAKSKVGQGAASSCSVGSGEDRPEKDTSSAHHNQNVDSGASDVSEPTTSQCGERNAKRGEHAHPPPSHALADRQGSDSLGSSDTTKSMTQERGQSTGGDVDEQKWEVKDCSRLLSAFVTYDQLINTINVAPNAGAGQYGPTEVTMHGPNGIGEIRTSALCVRRPRTPPTTSPSSAPFPYPPRPSLRSPNQDNGVEWLKSRLVDPLTAARRVGASLLGRGGGGARQ